MKVDQIVGVTISRETATATGTAFGVPLIMGAHPYWAARVADFSDLDSLAAAGVPTHDPIYRAARAMLLQSPRPSAFKVGRQKVTTVYVTVPVADVADSTEFSVTMNGVMYTHDSGTYATQETILDGLKSEIEGGTFPGTVVLNTDTADFAWLAITYAAGDFTATVTSPMQFILPYYLWRSLDLSSTFDWSGFETDMEAENDPYAFLYDMFVFSHKPAETLATALAACRDEDDGFYTIIPVWALEGDETEVSSMPGFLSSIIDSPALAEQVAFYEAVESLRKIAALADSGPYYDESYAVATAALSSWVTSNQSSVDRLLALDRTFNICHHKSIQYPDAAIVGKMAVKTPGSATWSYQNLSGQTANAWLASLEAYLRSWLGSEVTSIYTETAGLSSTYLGKVLSGEWIDIMVGVDYLTDLIETKIFLDLYSNDKIPFTNLGIAVIENRLREVFQLGAQADILTTDTDPEYDIPTSASVSAAMKAARTLPDVKFRWYLAGAIHKVSIEGRVAY